MTPAELKTLRESLSLPAQWVANQANVRLRTVQYWEAGRTAVPKDVADMLRDVDARIDQMALEALDAYRDAGPVTLYRYSSDSELWENKPDLFPWPAATHAVMLARLTKMLSGAGVASTIQYHAAENKE